MEQPTTRAEKLLRKTQYYISEHNKILNVLRNITSENQMFFPRMQELQLSKAMLLIMPRQRWHNIICTMFNGMEPPILKQQGTNMYLNIVVPENQMDARQRARIKEIKHNMPKTLWSLISLDEMIWICGSVHGMCINLQNMCYFVHRMIEDNKGRMENSHKDERGDETRDIDEKPAKRRR